MIIAQSRTVWSLWATHDVCPAAVRSFRTRAPGQQVGNALCKGHVRGATAPLGLASCRFDRPRRPIRAAVEADVAVTRQQLLVKVRVRVRVNPPERAAQRHSALGAGRWG